MTALLAPVMAHIYKQPTVATVTLALSPIFLIGAIGSQHGALLRRQMRFAALVTADILSAIGATVTGIVMALMGAGYWAIVVPYLISALICTISRAASSGWSPGLPVFNERVRSMVRFGLNIILFDGFGYFARNADNFLIGWRWGPAPLGLYSRAYLLLLFPLRQINMPAGAVAVPLLCRLQDQGERYQRAYVSMTNVLCMVTVPGIAFLIITADWVVRVALGPQWNGAAHIFRFLGFAALLQPLADTGAWLFVSQGRTKEYARWGCINGILTTLSFLIGLPGGPVGVSISYAVACLIASPILFYMIGRSGPVATKSLYTILIMPMAASLSMAAGLGVFRVLFWGIGPRAGLLFTFPLALALATGTYACTRDGRAVLSEFGFMLKSLIGRTATGTLIETLGAS
jgi:PST family polysaccharide transporter